MLELGVKTLIAYLLGALIGSLMLGRLRGVDIRSMGSGNAGATNALRTQGKLFGLSVLLIDVGKGVFAVLCLPGAALPRVPLDPELSREWLTLACGFAVIVGHVYPVWFGFRGGKGVATMVGVLAAMEPRLLLPLLCSWFAVLLLTGYVGLASMLAGVALVIAVYAWEPGNTPLLIFCLAVELLRDLHPSRQHRAHARGHRASREQTMAVSLPSGLEPRSLLVLLADGELHSGAALARELNVSRAALWRGDRAAAGAGRRGHDAGAARIPPAEAGRIAGCRGAFAPSSRAGHEIKLRRSGSVVRSGFDQYPIARAARRLPRVRRMSA